jgi:hypothetical protein
MGQKRLVDFHTFEVGRSSYVSLARRGGLNFCLRHRFGDHEDAFLHLARGCGLVRSRKAGEVVERFACKSLGG